MTTVIDNTTAYYRPPASHNARLTEVGRGTPMGELMRRYWHPVGLTKDASDLPKKVRALGEDLVLFRDGEGRAGLVYERCTHRGASLFYGGVDKQGIRCCYHGWLFDTQGRCLEQPGEPERGRLKDRFRQPWYPVQERYGLIWAYMGPAEKMPLLPRYDIFEELGPEDELFADDHNIGSGTHLDPVPFNWLQHYENIHDPAHFYWLHYLHSGPQFGDRFGELDLPTLAGRVPDLVNSVQYEVSARGLTARRSSDLPDGQVLHNTVETILPTLRAVPNPFGHLGRLDHIGFVLPVDDTHFRILTVFRGKDSSLFGRVAQLLDERAKVSVEETQRFPNDFEAQGGQGPITLHSEEHLASSDKGVAMLRRLFEAQLRAIAEGRDPIGVHFEPGGEYVRVEASTVIQPRQAAE